ARDVAWGAGDGDPGFLEAAHLRFRGALIAGDDRTGVAHALARRGRPPGDECDRGLLAFGAQVLGGALLRAAADLADDDDRFGRGVLVQQADRVRCRKADHRVAPHADAGRLAEARARQQVRDLVGERAAPRDKAHAAGREILGGHYSDLRLPGCDRAGTVRPDERRGRRLEDRRHLEHVGHGNPLGDRDDQLDLRVDRLEKRVHRGGRRDEDDRRVRAGLLDRTRDGVEHRDPVDERPARAGLRAADHLGPVLLHAVGVEASFPSHALDDDPRVAIKKNAHARAGSCARRTASAAASSIVARDSSAAPSSNLRPASASVPESRTTSGTLGGCFSITARMPFATSSPRVIPPKMLIITLRTRGFERTISSAAFTTASFAPPPTSRKFAARPPALRTASSVAITSPAPFPMIPTSPSSWTKLKPSARARSSASSSGDTSLSFASSAWRKSALSSTSSFASPARTEPSFWTKSGLISTAFASDGDLATLMPPAFPRPPACTCALTATDAPIAFAALSASSGVVARRPSGIGMPARWRICFAWYSWTFTPRWRLYRPSYGSV